ncbi:MAG: DUF2867 domain-containing protein [Acidimicrobiia bacterium]|nr:DUF2867 domain-containing protein [Acidimicrobiia bacterium]
MRLRAKTHADRRWRIDELTPDFELLDVWAVPTPGGPDDFGRFLDVFTSFDPTQSSSFAVRNLFAVRWILGDLLGLDTPESAVGTGVPSLRDRMPADLLDAAEGTPIETLPFQWLYVLPDEAAAEIANKTMHGVLHLGWVPDEDAPGGYRGQVAVLVKPNGLLGRAYLAFIKPFRHVLVYPAIFKEMEHMWSERDALAVSNRTGP